MGKAILVQGLRKRYGDVMAVDGISFEVQEGEIFGMVGPNGAGKTTTIECIEGLRRPDEGRIEVLGLDPQRDGYSLRERIGVQLQEAALPPRLKVAGAMDLFASFYPHPMDWHSLLEMFGLTEKAKAPFDQLSGGQKQRLFIALALVNNPDLLFLDELTTGLDPQARRAMWNLVRSIREQGKTVFLTTHYMDEAERLCDRVATIDHGQIVALDTPEALIRSLEAERRVVFEVDGPLDEERLQAVPGVIRVERAGERAVVYGEGDRLLSICGSRSRPFSPSSMRR
ncbi:MAG TPA: ABC transporter ATP-binding protein [Anaerolineales bacterium]|nr:ABC transporter ATP-binding protein [Anaerolineales bacterium]